MRQANANLDWSKTRLARRRGISPADGTIQEVYFRQGETVPPGRAVMSLLPPGNLKLRFFAPETQLPAIKYGATVNVSCDGCAPGLTAKVSFIADSAEYTPPVIYSLEERAKLVFLIEARPVQPEKFRVGQPVLSRCRKRDRSEHARHRHRRAWADQAFRRPRRGAQPRPCRSSAARSTASSGPTAPARPPPSACCADCSRRTRARAPASATTSAPAPT